jgi:hypothetical protein
MHRYEFTLDRFTRGILVVITILLAVIAVELWQQRPNVLPQAYAQIPDSGMQRNVAITEARETNRLLQGILTHLQSKPIKVEIETTDKQEDTRARRNAQ